MLSNILNYIFIKRIFQLRPSLNIWAKGLRSQYLKCLSGCSKREAASKTGKQMTARQPEKSDPTVDSDRKESQRNLEGNLQIPKEVC